MYRLWGKLIKQNRILDSVVIEYNGDSTNDDIKLNFCLEEICIHFDLQKPSWYSSNEQDYSQFFRTRFTQQNFIESIDFDYLEIELI